MDVLLLIELIDAAANFNFSYYPDKLKLMLLYYKETNVAYLDISMKNKESNFLYYIRTIF